MNGGGNISASPDAPQKWVSIPEYEKTIDLEHGRMRVRQRNHQNFVFAGVAGYLGAPNPAVTYLDGDIACNAAQNNRVRSRQRTGRACAPHRHAEQSGGARAGGVRHRAARSATSVATARGKLADMKFATGETVTLATRGDVGSAGMGPVDGARRESRRRDVPHRVHRVSAGERRDAADGVCHRQRLPQRRPEQVVRRQERGG